MTPNLSLDQLEALRLKWLAENQETIQKIITVVREHESTRPIRFASRTYHVLQLSYLREPITASLLITDGPFNDAIQDYTKILTLRVVASSKWDSLDNLLCLYRENPTTSRNDDRFIPGRWTTPFLDLYQEIQDTKHRKELEANTQEFTILSKILWLNQTDSPLVDIPQDLKG